MILPPPKNDDADTSANKPSATKTAQLETPVQPMHDMSSFIQSPSKKTSGNIAAVHGAEPSRSYAAIKPQVKARKLNLKVRKGSKAADLHANVDDMAEYLALLVARDPHDVKSLVELPSVRSARVAKGGENAASVSEESVSSSSSSSENRKHARHRSGSMSDGGHNTASGSQSARQKETDLWVYEHLHRLVIDLTPLLVALSAACNRSTCPEMKAGEWQYLCVAPHPVPSSGSSAGVAATSGGHGHGHGHGHASHGSIAGLPSADGGSADSAPPETECCAIDYIMHTIDSHVALWNSSVVFPSRLSIKPGSERLFGQQARRLSRVFGHAYHRHRELFEQCEAETSLYARFLALSQDYGLISKELLVIPIDATAGSKEPNSQDADDQESRKDDATESTSPEQAGAGDEDDDDDAAAFSRTQSQTAIKARTTKDVRPSAKAGRSLFPVEVTEEGEELDEDVSSPVVQSSEKKGGDSELAKEQTEPDSMASAGDSGANKTEVPAEGDASSAPPLEQQKETAVKLEADEDKVEQVADKET